MGSHREQAEEIVGQARDRFLECMTHDSAAVNAAIAQVHATLAVADALVALTQLLSSPACAATMSGPAPMPVAVDLAGPAEPCLGAAG